MIEGIYAVLGIFLIIAAKNPAGNRTLIAFTAWSSIVHLCPRCGCVLCWRGLKLETDGRRRIAVNVRLAPPESVAAIPIDHFDGLDTFDDLPRDHRCVRDMWF
jgi:hypothetical protein